MNQGFRHKRLKRLYEKDIAKGLSADMASKIQRVLARFDVATGPEMMNLPDLNLHPLKGALKGFWSVWVTGTGGSSSASMEAMHMMLIWSITIDQEEVVSMSMKNPPHPGLSVRHDCLEPLGLSVTKGAEVLGVKRQTLNNLVNGRAGISPEMAIRLDKAFGGTAEGWLALQMAFDLAQARKHGGSISVKRYKASNPATQINME